MLWSHTVLGIALFYLSCDIEAVVLIDCFKGSIPAQFLFSFMVYEVENCLNIGEESMLSANQIVSMVCTPNLDSDLMI